MFSPAPRALGVPGLTAYHRTMSDQVAPSDASELSRVLRDCGSSRRTLEIGGAFSKRTAGGEICPADVTLSTRELNQVIAYEPADLTISVEAGLRYSDLSRTLADKNQCLPLDPSFADDATIGGVIATNGCGPRRRRYGTARDMVIGMKFVTIEGKTVQSGGMVVKNVTGLDMGKLMIGSYGTLAAITVVNFKVFPIPGGSLSVVFSSAEIAPLAALRAEILGGVIQPAAIDLFNPEAAEGWGLTQEAGAYGLALEVEGNPATIERCRAEFAAMAQCHDGVACHALAEDEGEAFWGNIQETTARTAAADPEVHVIRISTLPTRTAEIFDVAEARGRNRPALIRAGNAVGYVYASGVDDAALCLAAAREQDLIAVVEYAPVGRKSELEQWAAPGSELAIMKRIKDDLDPQNLLNRGRLFNRL